jgi:hypothetical protein
MSELMDKILAAKARERKRLAALPFSEKVAILEKLRDRSLLISKSRVRSQIAAQKSSDGTGKQG